MEPGEDSKARKDIRRQKKIHSLERFIGRVYSPLHLEEVGLTPAGESVGEGKGERDAKEARLAGNRTAWEHALSRAQEGDFLDRNLPCPPGYRVVAFPSKRGEYKGTWDWRAVLEGEGPPQKVVRKRLKFPGYLIAHLRLTVDAFHLVTSARGVMSILMSNERPTPLASEEAAELLIQQSVVNKTSKKDKKVELLYAVGDRVGVVDGTWKNQVGRVVQISGTDADPVVTVEVTVLGHSAQVKIPHWLLIKKGK